MQSRGHLADFTQLIQQTRERFSRNEPEVTRQDEVIFGFVGRPEGVVHKSREVRPGCSPGPFCNVGRYGRSRPANLCRNPKTLVWRKRSRFFVDLKHESM